MLPHQTDLHESFIPFRDQCIWIHDCIYTFNALSEADAGILATAPRFFSDLNSILIEYILLQICKITDPPETCGHANLTINHLNAELLKADLMTAEIEEFSNGLMRYRKLITDARNKVISHLDRDTLLAGLILGAHAEEEEQAFLGNLHGYTDAVGIAVGVGPLDYRGGGPGDVWDLIEALRRAESQPTNGQSVKGFLSDVPKCHSHSVAEK